MFLLANVVDDADMGITHVVRGEEHVNGTPKYLLLARRPRPRLPTPCSPTCRCSSTSSARSCRSARTRRRSRTSAAEGYLPEAMVNYLALLGWGPPDGVEIRPLAEIVELFRLEDVTSSPAFFDVKKLQAFNAEYLRALPVDEFLERAGRSSRGATPAWPCSSRWRRWCRSACGSSPRSSRWSPSSLDEPGDRRGVVGQGGEGCPRRTMLDAVVADSTASTRGRPTRHPRRPSRPPP